MESTNDFFEIAKNAISASCREFVTVLLLFVNMGYLFAKSMIYAAVLMLAGFMLSAFITSMTVQVWSIDELISKISMSQGADNFWSLPSVEQLPEILITFTVIFMVGNLLKFYGVDTFRGILDRY